MKTSLHYFFQRQTFLFATISILGLSGLLLGQTAEIPYHFQSYTLESGLHHGSNMPGSDAVNVYTGIVELDDAPWLNLHFSKANLGNNSYILVTSLYDNYWQKLDAVTIEQWNYNTAYFNGSAVEIKLFVAPLDRNIFFLIDEVTVGEWVYNYQTDSQCGPTDDRMHSDQMATGRLLSIGCTAWIIPNGHFVSAGHCLDASSATVVEFQVPPSLPGGTIQHPGPEDQYSVDVSTKVFVNGGIGNDWGTFEVFPNSITGLMPKEAQGAFWPLVQNLGPDSIRITGYGVDSGVDNQTQQTHVGPNFGSSGTTMRYRTDTEGGNSGSPVIDALTNTAVGVHTHGGCTTSGTGNNSGTSTFLQAFWDAIDQGAGACPVGQPTDPIPANSANNVSVNLAELTWTNGLDAISNELYFGTNPGSLTLVQSGSLATSWTITGGPFSYSTTYFWKVVEIGDTCSTIGPVWSFTTELDPAITSLFCDDFTAGSGLWTITNDGGTCVWEALDITTNGYTLPGTAVGNVLAADADFCGSGTTLLSTATVTGIDASMYQTVWLEFDNDWNAIDAADFAYVDVSTDGGATWQNVLTFDVTDVRNTHENRDLTSMVAQSTFDMRFVSVQPGWDWWWAVDNVCVYATDIIPVELTNFTASINEGNVTLNWSTATETNNMGFEVQRTNESEYSVVGFVEGNGTTTEIQNYSFTDKNLDAGLYSYRLRQIDYDGTSEFSNMVKVEIIAPAVYSLSQNYPNPFNPSTKITFTLASDSKVNLTVFDVLGQEVTKLVNGNLASGRYSYAFNANGLNSGVYFYRIDATGVDGTNFSSVKKMLLTK